MEGATTIAPPTHQSAAFDYAIWATEHAKERRQDAGKIIRCNSRLT